MRSLILASVLVVAPLALAAQDNPFAWTSGSIKSAHISYEVTSKGKPVPGSSMEIGVSPQLLAVRMGLPFEFEGEKGTMNILVVEKGDSTYKLTDDDGEVSRSLRPYLAREYEALDAGGRARLRANLKLASALDDDDLTPGVIGEKTGTQTIAGYRCDVYRAEESTACVLPAAPNIPLSMTDKQGMTWVAKKVTINRALPAAMTALPKGIRWKKEHELEGADFALHIWGMKKQTDPSEAGPAAVAQFVVRFLASPQAAGELKAMGGQTSDESLEEPLEDSAEEDAEEGE